MPHKEVDAVVARVLLSHYERRNRSVFRRFLDTITTNNIAWAMIALFLFYVAALWTYTFSATAMRLGFFASFHAIYIPFKYTRLLGNIYGNMMYKCKPIAPKPKYNSKDVTIIVPTITPDMEELVSPFQSLINTGIHELIIVTVDQELHDKCSMPVERLMLANPEKAAIKVYSIGIRNKRIQLKAVLPFVTTKICALVDDDIWWNRNSLPWILAPFEDDKIGSVGVGMAAHPLPEGRGFNLKTIYHYLGAEYLARRNFDGAATLYQDNGISCMSGRTNVLRTSIIQDPAFLDAFVNERDLSRPGGPLLMNGEDNFITCWLFEHGIGMWVQYHPDAYLETTLEMDKNFLQQCIRWASSSWRGNYKLLFPLGFAPWTLPFWANLKVVSTRQPRTFFAKDITVFLSHTLITDPLFFAGHYYSQDIFAKGGLTVLTGTAGWCIAVGWYLFTKVVKKLTDLYLLDPTTIIFFPISLVFGLYHNWIKFTTFMEIDKGWRTRGFDLIADTSEKRDLVWLIRAILTVVIIVVEWTAFKAISVTRATTVFIWNTVFSLTFYTAIGISAAVHAIFNAYTTREPCRLCKLAWRLNSKKMKTASMTFGHLRPCEEELAPLLQLELEDNMDAQELKMDRAQLEKKSSVWAEFVNEKTPCNTSACDYFSAQTISA